MQVQQQHINERITIDTIKSYNIESYDDDNLYPQNINSIINGSGTAKNCTDRLASFLLGSGLSDKSLEVIYINQNKEQLKDLITNIVKDYTKYRGFAVWRRLTGDFKTYELYNIPLEFVRLCPKKNGEPLLYAIYNNWDGSQGHIKKDDIKYVNEWVEDIESINLQIENTGEDNYEGQLMYYSEDGTNCYPLAWVDSIQEDCIVDNQIKIFNYKNITTNFLASHMLFFKNEADEQTKAHINKSIKNLQGADNASKFNIMYGVESSEVSIKKIDIQNHDNLFAKTNEIIKENIRERFGQNLPFFKGGLSSSDMSGEAIKTTYEFYNALTKQYRSVLENYLTYVLKNYHTGEFLNKYIYIEPLKFEMNVIR